MTQELYQNAMKFAGEKHYNQTVPGTNANYLLHISNVAMEVLLAHSVDKSFDLDSAIQMAILHDILEDTATSFEELRSTFGEDIAIGVQALTKDKSLPSKQDMMLDSLSRINAQPKEVGLVKLADRITNLQAPPTHWNKEKATTYWEEARLIAQHLTGKNEFLHNRLIQKITEYQKYLDFL